MPMRFGPLITPRALACFAATLLVAAFLVNTQVAYGSPAHVDREFGSDGVEFLPSSLDASTGMALSGDGRVIVVEKGEKLAALLPSGHLDPEFGEGGYAHLTGPKAARVYGYSVAVDPQGRPVVVGRASTATESKEGRDEPLVERFTPAGQPDPEFGGGLGYVTSNFGLPPRPEGGPRQATLYGAAFDSTGRITLWGQSRVGTALAHFTATPYGIEQNFLARLEPSGQVDPSFAENGLYPQAVGGAWAVEPDGGVVVASSPHSKVSSFLRLGEDGRLDAAFAEGGRIQYPENFRASVLVDSSDRTIIARRVEGVHGRLPNGMTFERLLPDGSPDPEFGHGGNTTVRIPQFSYAELALDEEGRVLMAVSLKERGPVGESKGLAVVRLGPDGSLDESFGHDGLIRIKLPGTHYFANPEGGLSVSGGKAAFEADYCSEKKCRTIIVMVDLGTE